MGGYLSEIFASFEGEGARVGMPAVFLRLSGCNLACSFCDTVYARERAESATLYTGMRESLLANPVSPERVLETITRSFPGFRDVLITGGEPLLQADFAGRTAELLGEAGMGLHLETNGTLAGAVARAGRFFDTITMDLKLPSTQDGKNPEEQHAAFLAALARPDIQARVSAKIVVTPECADQEVYNAFRLLHRFRPRAPVFLQPEFDETGPVVGGERMMDLMLAGNETLADVRISLQIHKVLRMR